MNRRQLLTITAAGAASQIVSTSNKAEAATPKKALMKLGCQSGPTNEQHLQFFKRHSVNNICGYPEDSGKTGYYTVEDISKTERSLREAQDLRSIASRRRSSRPATSTVPSGRRSCLARVPSATATSSHAEHHQELREGRHSVDQVQHEPARRASRRSARRDAAAQRFSTWRLADAKTSGKFTPVTKAGPVNADRYWERITYFLERVIPVANEYKIRMACHPHDPGVPPGEGFQGIDAVLGTVDGLKKFVSIKESPYHGLNFCQGTVSEMLQDPGKEIYDVIRYFGSRKKIFNVHFRNIRGKRNDFSETYPDEGDVDFVKAMRVYREVGYPYMMMPDHVPQHPDDRGGLQAFAFAYGHIRALIQAMNYIA